MADDEETLNVDGSSSSLKTDEQQAVIKQQEVQIILYSRRGKPSPSLQVSQNADPSSLLKVDEDEVIQGENLTKANTDLHVESSSIPSVVEEVIQVESLRKDCSVMNVDSSSISASVMEEAITTENVDDSSSSLQLEQQAVIGQHENLVKTSEDMNVVDPSSLLQEIENVDSSSLLQVDEKLNKALTDMDVVRSSVLPANDQVIQENDLKEVNSPSLLHVDEELVVVQEEEEGLIEDINVDSSLLVPVEEIIQETNFKEVPDSSSLIQVDEVHKAIEEEKPERASIDMNVDASTLAPVIEEGILEKTDSSSLLQVDEVLVPVELEENLIKVSAGMDVDSSAVHAVAEEVILEEIEEENFKNVDSSAVHVVVEEVIGIEEEILKIVDSSVVHAVVGEVIAEENLPNVDSSAVHAVVEHVIAEEIEEENLPNVDSSAVHAVVEHVIAEEIEEENLSNVDSSDVHAVVEQVIVEDVKEENLNNVDSSDVHAVVEQVIEEEVEEENLPNVDSYDVHAVVEEVIVEVIEEENHNNADSSAVHAVVERVIVEELEEENLPNVDSSAVHAVVEQAEEKNIPKVDSSVVHVVVEEIIVDIAVVNDEENLEKSSTERNMDLSSIIEEVTLINADTSSLLEVDEGESLEKTVNEMNVDSTSISASAMEEEAIQTEDVVQALLEYLVEPVLPIKSSSGSPDDSTSLLIAKQMHAVVLLYNYYHRKQFPHLEFLDFESFCKVSVNVTPGLCGHIRFMQICKPISGEPEDLLSPTEKAIQDACNIATGLDASKDSPCTDGWPVSKVAIFLTDNTNCFLMFSATTQGVWSLIEKTNDESNHTLEDKLEKLKGNKKNKIRKWPLGGDINVDQVSFHQLAFSVVEEATGIGRADLRVLENHVVPSLSADTSTAYFYLMKCIKPFREDLAQVPIEDAINSLHGPLVKMEYGSCSVCEVVDYFHLLPYAGVLSNWLPRAGLEEANMEEEDSLDTDDSDSDPSSLHPVTEEAIGEDNTKKVDSSSLLQVEEEVIQEENSIKLSTDMNVESSSIPLVVEEVIQEESLGKEFNERNVDSSSISASVMEEAISTENVDESSSSLQLYEQPAVIQPQAVIRQQENLVKTSEDLNDVYPSSLLQVSKNVHLSSLLQVDEDEVVEGKNLIKANTDMDVGRSSVLPANEQVIQKNDLKEVNSPCLLQADAELGVVEEEEGLIKASVDINVDSSLLVPVEVIEENNLKEVRDSSSLIQVDEVHKTIEEEKLEKASTYMNVDAPTLVPVIEEGILEKADSSSLLQVDEVLVVVELEENLIKAAADMDVDSSAVHAVVEQVIGEEIEEENLSNVDSSAVHVVVEEVTVDIAVVNDEENLVKASTERNMDLSSIAEEVTLIKADSSSLPQVDIEESLEKAVNEMNVGSTSISASTMEEEEEEAIQTEDVVQALLEYLVEPVLPIKSSSGTPDDSTSLLIAKQMHAVVLLYNYYHRKQFPHLEFLDFESFCKVSVNAIPGLCGHMKFMQICKPISSEPEDLLSPTEKAIQDACSIAIGLDASKDSPCIDGWPVSKVAIFLTDSTNCFLMFSATTQGVWSPIEKTNDDSNLKLEDKLEKLKGNKKNTIRKRPLGGDINADQVSFRQLAISIVEEATGIDCADLRVLGRHVVPSLSAEKSTACFYLMKCIKPLREDLTKVPIEDAINSLHGPLVKMEYGICSVCEVVNYFHLLPYAGVLSDWLPSRYIEEVIERQNIENVVEEAENLIKASTHMNVDSSSPLPVSGEENTKKVDSSSLLQVDEEVVIQEENTIKLSTNKKVESSSIVIQEENSIKLSTNKKMESSSTLSVVEEVTEDERLRKDFNESNVDSSSISASVTEEAITTENVVQALLDYLVGPALPALPVKSYSSEVLDDSASLLLENSIAIQMHAVVLLYNYYHRKQFPHHEFLDFESFCKVSVKATPGLLEHMKFRCKSLSNEPDDLLSPMEKAIQDACNISLTLDASKDASCTEGWPVSKVAIFLMDSMRNCFLVYGSITQGVWSLIEEADDCLSNKLEDKSKKQKGNMKKKIRKWPLGGDINADEVTYRRIAFSIVKEATGIGHADLRVLDRHVLPSLSAEKSTACFYLMKCIKPFHEDLTSVPTEDAINSLHGPLVKMEDGSCSVCEAVNYFHLLPYAGVLLDWLPRVGLEEPNIDYFLETDDSDSDILVESYETPAIPSTSNILGNKRRKSTAEKVNKNLTTERLNKNIPADRVNKNSPDERVKPSIKPSTTERVNMDGSMATTNKNPVIHINKKMKFSTDSNSRSTHKRVGMYEVPLVQVGKVDFGKEAGICGRSAEVPCENINLNMGNSGEDENPREQAYEFITQNLKKKPRLYLGKRQESTTSAEVPCENMNLNMGNSGEDEIPREQAYEFITQNLNKKPGIIPPKMCDMLQVTLRMLHTRCNELSGLQRDLQDHIAICEKYLQTMPNEDSDLTEKIERILDACTVAIARASLQNSIESDRHFGTMNLHQEMKSKNLSEAVLSLPNACKDLDTICRQNNWTLPAYNLLSSNGEEGFRARVVVQGLDFECSEGGHMKPDPREARESAAIRVLTKLRTMQQDNRAEAF